MQIIVTGSLTYAHKARRVLEAAGIRARLLKAEADLDGCAYGVQIDAAHSLAASALLRKAGIPIKKIL